jgi:monothiol glutaredoxin
MNPDDANPQAAELTADSQPSSLRDQIREAIAANDVILFMKGTPEAPACGFSARTVASLEAVGTAFASVDVLADPRIRQELSALSNWPTIPQLFVDGELVGGCDIVTEMHESGELGDDAAGDPADAAAAPGPTAQAAGFTPVENRLT